MEEINAGRIAAVFSADTHFHIRTGFAALFHRNGDQLPDPFLIDHLERIVLEYALINIIQYELSLCIIPADSKGHLGQIIGSETEKLGDLGDFVGGESRAGISIIVPNL